MPPINIELCRFTEPAIFDNRSKGANAAMQNPAVARCCEAWQRAFQDVMAKKDDEDYARWWAQKAFRNAMPALSGQEGIRDFVACAAHGLLISNRREAASRSMPQRPKNGAWPRRRTYSRRRTARPPARPGPFEGHHREGRHAAEDEYSVPRPLSSWR